MTRDEMLKDIYEFYKVISKDKLQRTFEHYQAMSSSKTDKEVADQWLFIEKFKKQNPLK